MKKVLIIAPRDPWPPHKGYAVRTFDWLDALAGQAEVTLVAPVASASAHELPLVVPKRSIRQLIKAIARTVAGRMPLQPLFSAAYDWAEAIRRANAEHGPFDAEIVILSRTAPWVEPHLRSPLRILDAIDSLAANARERARGEGALVRLFWHREAAAMARLERSLALRFQRVIVVSPAEVSDFGASTSVVPIGVAVSEVQRQQAEWDFAFTGRLAYFANRNSVDLLLEKIWPEIRRQLPSATLLIAGADAPRSILRHHGRDGITVLSPFPDRRVLLSRVRIALLSVTHGSGQSMKTIEAAEAGCAIVGTTLAFRGAEMLKDVCVVRDVPAELANAAVAMTKGDAAEKIGARAREIAIEHYSRQTSLVRLAREITGAAA